MEKGEKDNPFLSRLSGERISFGAGLVWAVYFICMFDYPLFSFNVPQSRANNMFNMTMLVTLSLLLVLTGMFLMLHRPHLSKKQMQGLVIGGSAFLGIGIVMGFSAPNIPSMTTALYVIGGICSGVGFDVVLGAWMGCFCSEFVRSERFHITLSFGFGALVAFVTLYLNVWATLFLVIALVAISCYCICVSFDYEQAQEQGEPRKPDLVHSEKGDGGKPALRADIIGYGLCTIILSLIYTLVGQVALSVPAGYSIIHLLTVFFVFVAGLFAFMLEISFKGRFDLRTIYKIAFAVLATGLFFLPFLSMNYWLIFNVLVVFSFYLFFIRFILLLSTVYNKQIIEGMGLFCLVTGLVFGISLVGVFAGTMLAGDDGLNTVKLLSIAFGSLYLLALGLMPLIRRSKEIAEINVEDSDWNETKEQVIHDMQALHSLTDAALDKPLWFFSEDELVGLCDRFAVHYHLTTREREILPFIVKGRTATEIAEALYVTPSTVKGHMRTLYRKCDVHSKAELIGTVERDRICWWR